MRAYVCVCVCVVYCSTIKEGRKKCFRSLTLSSSPLPRRRYDVCRTETDLSTSLSFSLQPRWRCHSIPVPISSFSTPSPFWKPSSSYRIPITTRAHNNLISPHFNGPSLIRLQLTAAARCRFKWPSFILFYLNKVEKTKSFQKKNMLTQLLRLWVSLVFATYLPTFVHTSW